MKKLMLLVTVFVAVLSQKSNAQISFDFNISSGPRYVAADYASPLAYYEPRGYYVPSRSYYAPAKRVVYVERHHPSRYRKAYVAAPRQVYTRSYYRPAPRQGYYVKYKSKHYKHAGKGHYKR